MLKKSPLKGDYLCKNNSNKKVIKIKKFKLNKISINTKKNLIKLLFTMLRHPHYSCIFANFIIEHEYYRQLFSRSRLDFWKKSNIQRTVIFAASVLKFTVYLLLSKVNFTDLLKNSTT